MLRSRNRGCRIASLAVNPQPRAAGRSAPRDAQRHGMGGSPARTRSPASGGAHLLDLRGVGDEDPRALRGAARELHHDAAGEAAPYLAMCRDAGRGLSTESAIRALRALAEWDVCERLGEVSVPALVICGDRDRSTAPDQSYRLWEGIADSVSASSPGARTTCISNARSCSRTSCSTFSPGGEGPQDHSIFAMRGAPIGISMRSSPQMTLPS